MEQKTDTKKMDKKPVKLTFPANIFDFSVDDEVKYEEMKKHPDMKSQMALIGMYRYGPGFQYTAMKGASEFISNMINMAVDKGDSKAQKFILNFINAFMFGFDNKDLRNAFYREISFSLRDESLWRISPDMAVRHLLETPEDAKECKCFNLFKGGHWCALLSKYPEKFETIADKYDGFKKLIYFHEESDDGSWHMGYTEVLSYWGNLLRAQPRFKEKCRIYNGFADLCSESPDPLPSELLDCLVNGEEIRVQLIGYDEDEFDEYYSGENGWVELLKSTKEFDAEFEEFQAYYSLSDDDWNEVLKVRPELERLKPVERDLEKYPSFDFSDSCRCENDDWNECDVGGVENPELIPNRSRISKLWYEIMAKREQDGATEQEDEEVGANEEPVNGI